jgi:hypothetical protein
MVNKELGTKFSSILENPATFGGAFFGIQDRVTLLEHKKLHVHTHQSVRLISCS